MAVRNTPINGIETDLEKQLVDAIEFDEQCDKQAAARIAELVKKDRLLKVENQECLRQTFSCLPNKVSIQPTSPQAYLDRTAGIATRQSPIEVRKYQNLLSAPAKKPPFYDKILHNLASLEKVNLDANKVIAPALRTIKYYNTIYKHRKVFYNSKPMFQLEYTLELVDDIWMYILHKEFSRVNPNTNITFKWIHQSTDDFIDGYCAYQDVFTSNEDIQFDYAVYQVDNYYHRLKIDKKIYALTMRIYPTLRNFPKYERQALAADIRKMLIKIRANVEEGASCKSIRKQKYQLAIGIAHELNTALLLSEEQGYISINFGINMRLAVGEIIKMLRRLLQAETSGMKQGGISMKILPESVN